ncbi:hypothetical protein [Gilliamella sp. Imp1-1]|uniref:hypothetical protein n=1 Tax=Gilliamella sp. Imp1-1 TaxID=3120248 RepID=UPI00159F2B55|nr:hypothetical protein [Gilliamella apicola]
MPRVRDLTNAVRKEANFSISGAAPSSSGNFYMRHIGAGFSAEWGDVYYSYGFSMDFPYYLTSDYSGYRHDLTVLLTDGQIARGGVTHLSRQFLCTAP